MSLLLQNGGRFQQSQPLLAVFLDPAAEFLRGAPIPRGTLLASVPAAVQERAAILLTAGTTQSRATARYLTAHAGSRFGVGHAAAVADPSATALAGVDRYETAAQVANTFFAAPGMVGIASGATFADALTGGPMLGAARRPMLLVPPSGALPPMVMTYLRRHANALMVFGGTKAVHAEMLAQATSVR